MHPADLRENALSFIESGNYADGVYMLFQAWDSGDYQTNQYFLNKAIIKSLPLTQDALSELDGFKLALCYLLGLGVKQTDIEAEKIFLSLSEKHHAASQTLLAWMCLKGRAGLDLANQTVRNSKAVALFQKAADVGQIAAQAQLASMYENGLAGLDLVNQAARDSIAVDLYQKASEVENAYAYANLGKLYLKGRAGLDLVNQDARDSIALKLYQNAVDAGCPNSTWNLALRHKKNKAYDLALTYYSTAAILYGSDQANTKHCIDKITSFPPSMIKSYALERIPKAEGDNITAQCGTLMALKSPSDYLLFFDHDMKFLKWNDRFWRSLVAKIVIFSESFELDSRKEKSALLSMVLKMLEAQLAILLKKSMTIEKQLEELKLYFDLLGHLKLSPLLVEEDKENQKLLAEIGMTLLSFVLVDDGPIRFDFINKFVRLITNIHESSAFWQEANIIRLLCFLFTSGHYIPTSLMKQPNAYQIKALLMHYSQNPLCNNESSSLDVDGQSYIDEMGLQLMAYYGVRLMDIDAVKTNAAKILGRYTSTASSSVTGVLERQVQLSPRFHPLLNYLSAIQSMSRSHEILMILIHLKQVVENPGDKHRDLAVDLKQLLNEAGLIVFETKNPTNYIEEEKSHVTYSTPRTLR